MALDFLLSKLLRKRLPDDIFLGATDIHTHIMPEVDDGVDSLRETVDIIRMFEKAGVKRMIMTPHFMMEFSQNRKPAISAEFFQNTRTLSDMIKTMQLYVAAEYMVDKNFLSHRNDGWMTLGTTNQYLLVETSYITPNSLFDNGLYELSLDGIIPVIAHPERYQYGDLKTYKLWKNNGYRLQLNLLSLTNCYGSNVKDKAVELLNDGMYDFIGSDIHDLNAFKSWFSTIRLNSDQIDKIRVLVENNEELFRK